MNDVDRTTVSMTDKKVNILLVDDQPAKLLSYEVMLGGLEENLIKANTANEALEQLLRNDVAVVLIDVCMPDLDGFELASMIREHPRFEKTAIIFVSAIHLTDVDRVRGYECGAVDYVPVPVVPALLQAKVRVFVDLYRKTRQLEELNNELEDRVAQRTAELERINSDLEQRVEDRTRERQAALAQIHEMQKIESLGKLTGGVAHDFNNLLMAVLTNLNLVRKRVESDVKLTKLIDGAIQGAKRGATLTSRMLSFARRQELKPETVHIPALVDGMIEMMTRSLGPTIEICTDFTSDLTPVSVDPNQLELALLNLALNSRDAMPLGGKITISARCEKLTVGNARGLSAANYVCLAVSDAGVGMEESVLKRAAEPFFTTKILGKGTGLGLSMVQGFTVQSGGSVDIRSELNVGTTVELWLPSVQQLQPAKPVDSPEPVASKARCHKILIVDDDPLILESTVAAIEDLGHFPIQAASSTIALEIVHSGTEIDLVITDHAMPCMTGVDLAHHIRQARPELPIILATGYAELPANADASLVRLAKPYSQEEMAAAIERQMRVGLAATNVVSFDTVRRA
jgi:signal transduction histidine kinase